ncbi:hypothetical protein TGAMA5MH_11083 [Trichoderma gamsii]|uniref:2EXR domain-containing protein n=1 Tax=Trichoderma gamsii TaxID=398673 RepID=A0A2K0SUS6_9HYPO|nr:hypothetical protein TGAMA5MH_11083 [Trichoderma gamsii]
MALTAFPLFALLPTELRLQIWHEALLPSIRQPLYFYEKGCWGARHLTETDPDYDPDNDEHNLYMEFDCGSLAPLKVDIPLFYVNQEARGSVLSWIHHQGLAIRFSRETQSPVFIRSFDPKRDTLYVSEDQWHDFHVEPFDRMFEPDLENKLLSCPAPAFRRLAVPSALIMKEPRALEELFHWYYGIDEILLIVEARPDEFWHEDNEIKVQQRWEPECGVIQWPTFCWNHASDGFLWKGNSDVFSNDPLYKLLQDIGPQLVEKLRESTKQRFEIRPILVVKE